MRGEEENRWASAVGGLLDRALLGLLRPRFAAERAVGGGGEEDDRAGLLEVAALYRRRGDAAGLDPCAPPTSAVVTRERRGRLGDGGTLFDLAWPSGYVPIRPPAGEGPAAALANRRACARLYRHEERARPTLLLLHGYRGGHFATDSHLFAASAFYRLGLDVALFTLPYHGRRGGAVASWPSSDLGRTNEGFLQAAFDLRALLGYLAAPKLAVVGASLGGYLAALLATLEPLDFVCPVVPVADWAELLFRHGAGGQWRRRAERQGIDQELLKEVLAIHCPLLRTPKVAGANMLVVTATGDRVAPKEHGERLAAHFGCELLRLPGGHLAALGAAGRRQLFAAIRARLYRVGVI